MKKILVFILSLVVVLSLSIPVFADSVLVPDYPEGSIPSSGDVNANDYFFTVGTTGGGSVNTVGSLCLTTALIYLASPDYPSFSDTYDLASHIWKRFSQYEQDWFQSNCAVLLEYPVRIPQIIVSQFNVYLKEAGSSIRLPSNLYALSPFPAYYDLNNVKSTKQIFLTESQFVELYGDNWQDVVLSDIKGLSEFSDRLQRALFTGIQFSIDATYRQISSIRKTLYEWNLELNSEYSYFASKVAQSEAGLIDLGKAKVNKGLDYLTTSENLLNKYTDGFYFFHVIFDLFYELVFIKTLLYFSLAIGMFSFVVNIGQSIGMSVRSSISKSSNKSSNKKG